MRRSKGYLNKFERIKMASEHSFDISAEVDMMEVKNALETAKKRSQQGMTLRDLRLKLS